MCIRDRTNTFFHSVFVPMAPHCLHLDIVGERSGLSVATGVSVKRIFLKVLNGLDVYKRQLLSLARTLSIGISECESSRRPDRCFGKQKTFMGKKMCIRDRCKQVQIL